MKHNHLLLNSIHNSRIGSNANTGTDGQGETNVDGMNATPTPTPTFQPDAVVNDNDIEASGITQEPTWTAPEENADQTGENAQGLIGQAQTGDASPEQLTQDQAGQEQTITEPVVEIPASSAEPPVESPAIETMSPSPAVEIVTETSTPDLPEDIVVPKSETNWMKIGGIALAAALAVAVGAAVMFRLLKGNKKKKTRRVNVPSTAPLDEDSSPTSPAQRHGGIQIGNAQAIGSRQEQQDSFGISDNTAAAIAEKGLLAVVADGMGGLSNGAVYSSAAVQAALRSFYEEEPEKNDEATLLRVLKRAKEAVEATGLSDGGTTFIATLIRDQKLHFVSVGDSRISLMRNGGLIQLNREHVYGRELDDLATNGLLSESDAARDSQRSALTSYLGKQSDMLIDRNISAIPLYSGDKIILMSDGVYGYMQEEYLTRLLLQKPMEAAMAVQKALMDKRKPNQDNLTIIILEIE